LENFKQLRENHRDLLDNYQELETGHEQLANRYQNLEQDINENYVREDRFTTTLDKVLENMQNIENRMTNRVEDAESRIEAVATIWENKATNIDNRLTSLKTTTNTKLQNLTEDMQNEKNEKTGTVALVIGVLGVLGTVGLFGAIHQEYFAEKAPQWRNQDPKDQILSAYNLIDHRLESNAPIHLIEGAKAQRERLVEQHPEIVKELVEEEELGEESLNRLEENEE